MAGVVSTSLGPIAARASPSPLPPGLISARRARSPRTPPSASSVDDVAGIARFHGRSYLSRLPSWFSSAPSAFRSGLHFSRLTLHGEMRVKAQILSSRSPYRP